MAVALHARHVYEYVFTDSKNEREFVRELDSSIDVVDTKLPRSSLIPTPVSNYKPDWAIVFEEGKVKHIYVIPKPKAPCRPWTSGSLKTPRSNVLAISSVRVPQIR
jgi:restriction endonuclease